MYKILFVIFVLNEILISKYLTFDEAVLKSPFKVASLGKIYHLPNEDAYLIRGEDNNWNKWYKVTIPNMDTLLFIDEKVFSYKGDELLIDDLIFSKDGKKLLVKTDTKKIWRHSNTGTYFVFDINTKLLHPLTKDNFNLRNVKFSPNGQYVAYVRLDNN